MKKPFLVNLAGLGLFVLGILLPLMGFVPFSILIIIGVLLFLSIPDENVFFDCVTVNSNELLFRKRHYQNLLPFTVALSIITLGHFQLNVRIPWKEEYFRAANTDSENPQVVKITRKEYKDLLNKQLKLYETQAVSKEFMKRWYSPENIDIRFKHKKWRLIIVSILAGLVLLTGLTEPVAIYLVPLYEAILLPMIILWIPDYKNAKILQQAYDRAMMQ